MLSSLAKLEAIRNKALKDLDKLVALREEAKDNPVDFVRKLQSDPKVGSSSCCLRYRGIMQKGGLYAIDSSI